MKKTGNCSHSEPGEFVNRVAKANLANSNLEKKDSSDRQNCGGPRLGVKSYTEGPANRELWRHCLHYGFVAPHLPQPKAAEPKAAAGCRSPKATALHFNAVKNLTRGNRPEWADTTLAGVREPPVRRVSRSEKA